ncbi:MAG: discoidin domain-containing protein, partial [Muribaculaceae bacterium]|nr:discoidin domain-containing protein [Muribaculaceae bacterium]
MKKFLLSMAAMSLVAVAAHAQENWEVQSRAGWAILGCSQQNNGHADASTDGGFPHVIDDDPNTFWHARWQGAAADNTANHYLIIDRGTNAGSFGGFGYLPRQGKGGNGYVTDYAIYVVDELSKDVTNSTCSTDEAKQLKDGAHNHMQEFLANLTPAVEGTFDFEWNSNSYDVTDHNERRVKLDAAATGRYVIFLIKDAIGAERYESATASRVWGNCAELYLYTVEVEDNREAAQALLDSAIDHMTPGYFSKEHAEYAPLAEALQGDDNGAINVAYRAARAADLTQASASALYFISSTAGEMVTTAAGAPLTAETVAEHNEAAMWGFVEVAGKMYLYNAATKELANVWGTSEETNGTFWYGNPGIGSAFTIALGSDHNVTVKADGTHGLTINTNAVADATAEISFEWAGEADAEVTAALIETIKTTCAEIDATIVASYEGENTVGHYT